MAPTLDSAPGLPRLLFFSYINYFAFTPVSARIAHARGEEMARECLYLRFADRIL